MHARTHEFCTMLCLPLFVQKGPPRPAKVHSLHPENGPPRPARARPPRRPLWNQEGGSTRGLAAPSRPDWKINTCTCHSSQNTFESSFSCKIFQSWSHPPDSNPPPMLVGSPPATPILGSAPTINRLNHKISLRYLILVTRDLTRSDPESCDNESDALYTDVWYWGRIRPPTGQTHTHTHTHTHWTRHAEIPHRYSNTHTRTHKHTPPPPSAWSPVPTLEVSSLVWVLTCVHEFFFFFGGGLCLDQCPSHTRTRTRPQTPLISSAKNAQFSQCVPESKSIQPQTCWAIWVVVMAPLLGRGGGVKAIAVWTRTPPHTHANKRIKHSYSDLYGWDDPHPNMKLNCRHKSKVHTRYVCQHHDHMCHIETSNFSTPFLSRFPPYLEIKLLQRTTQAPTHKSSSNPCWIIGWK